MARKLIITNEERRAVTELGGPWVCNVQTLAEQAMINPARAAHIIMRMRGEKHERETDNEAQDVTLEPTIEPEPVLGGGDICDDCF